MNKNHLNKILCPLCLGSLYVIDSYKNKTEVDYGIVECYACKSKFPVINGVLRLLSGSLMNRCIDYYAKNLLNSIDEDTDAELTQWLVRMIRKCGRHNLPIGTRRIDFPKGKSTNSRTVDAFAYEWHKWKHLPNYAEDNLKNISGSYDFKGKVGWDPAVGMGRHLESAIKAVGKNGFMFASDLSYSIDIARDRCKQYENVMFIQSDMRDISYLNCFVSKLDFAYMIGVIQHLPDPTSLACRVAYTIKDGGYFFGTVYTAPKDILMKVVINFVKIMRIFTTRLPFWCVNIISIICATPAYLFFKLPQCILNKFGYVQAMNRIYPNNQTQKGNPDFDLLVHAWFDHFVPPITKFFKEEEIKNLLDNLPITPEYSDGIIRGRTNWI